MIDSARAVPPIFVNDNGDLQLYPSFEIAERAVEVQDLPTMRIYDSEGRSIKGCAKSLSGVAVYLQLVEAEPEHADELRAAIVELLDHLRLPHERLRDAPLKELVEMCQPYLSKY